MGNTPARRMGIAFPDWRTWVRARHASIFVDGAADFMIELKGRIRLTEGDFVL